MRVSSLLLLCRSNNVPHKCITILPFIACFVILICSNSSRHCLPLTHSLSVPSVPEAAIPPYGGISKMAIRRGGDQLPSRMYQASLAMCDLLSESVLDYEAHASSVHAAPCIQHGEKHCRALTSTARTLYSQQCGNKHTQANSGIQRERILNAHVYQSGVLIPPLSDLPPLA